MEKNVQSWPMVTKNIYTAVLIIAAATILSGLFGFIDKLSGGGFADMAEGLASGSLGAAFAPDFFDVVGWILSIGLILGSVFYIIGLAKFKAILSEQDAKATNMVFIGAIILAAAGLLSFIPFTGIITWIAELVAYILMLVGFNNLKKSTTIDGKAVEGFTRNFKAILFIIIAIGANLILGWIPVLGWIINIAAWVLTVIAFFMFIKGWATVKDAPVK